MCPTGPVHGGIAPGEARGGRQTELVTRVQAEPSEQPGRGIGQRSVRPLENAAHCVGPLLGLGCQNAPPGRFVAQVVDQLAERHGWPARRAFGGDTQCQRQSRAQSGQRRQVSPTVAGPVIGGGSTQQFYGVRRGERCDVQAQCALLADQAGQVIPAGHHDEATGGGGQQWTDLRAVRGVVEYERHAALGDQRPEHRLPALRFGRYMRGGDAEILQEAAQYFLRCSRGARGVAPQIGVELTAWEMRPDAVCPVQCQ
ncbi:hypothetical protein QFZ49_004032 [Streptomyces turgidiscabies]|uniref:Uncharacterized protein n=1 Tax=Streptomyces turgidiscabies TaxID=85558 RepID=A0ABU0RQ26_9ACTN|nr:hypothetical protein [Streptomyces turgidiscabies]